LDLFGTLVDGEGRALPGAAALLGALSSARWGVVTSCPRSFASALIAQAGLPKPPLLVAAEDVESGKPAPDGYLLAARHFGVDPVACVVVEDSAHGIMAGLAAGMHVVAIAKVRARGYPQAVRIVDSIAQISVTPVESGVRVTLEVPLD
jgi:sugar-phosphatase